MTVLRPFKLLFCGELLFFVHQPLVCLLDKLTNSKTFQYYVSWRFMDKTTGTQSTQIVFLDDDISVLDLVGRKLKNMDVEYQCFQTPDLAIEYILQSQPEIVVLDYLMPISDGEEILISLKASSRYNSYTYVWSSTELPRSVNERIIKLGATPMLKQALFEQDFVVRLCKTGNLKESVIRF